MCSGSNMREVGAPVLKQVTMKNGESLLDHATVMLASNEIKGAAQTPLQLVPTLTSAQSAAAMHTKASGVCWGFVISILIGSAGTELKAKNISKKSLSYQKQFPYLCLPVF